VVSRVANFAIDLPDASMAIQVSGSFGSRQEEAQRLGRILRPKARGQDGSGGRNSWFYTLVSRSTVEEDFAANLQQFLAEQGYKYSIQHWTAEELAAKPLALPPAKPSAKPSVKPAASPSAIPVSGGSSS
jgi:DNA excision repair protein ERCC-3